MSCLAAQVTDWWSFAGFHAAVFAGVVIALLVIQWMRGGDDR